MMSRNSNILMAVITGAVGILLVVMHSSIDLLNWLSIAVGVMLIVPSVCALWPALTAKGALGSGVSLLSIAGLLLGLAMCIFPGFFAGFFVYVLGVVLIIFGIYHFVDLAGWRKMTSIPLFFYVIPVLLIVAGVVILCSSVHNINSVVVLITGIALIASAINSIMEWARTSDSAKSVTESKK